LFPKKDDGWKCVEKREMDRHISLLLSPLLFYSLFTFIAYLRWEDDMNEKEYRRYFVIIAVIAILLIFAGGVGGFVIRGAHTGDSAGVERNTERERELLARIGEYQQREQERVDRERKNAAREAELNRAARERAVRLETAVGAIRVSDRRTGELLQEIAKEINFLADYIGSLGGGPGGDADSGDSE